ncbi:MAG: AI-2E family transporter [Gammaproteobacteria bacterium]|nr:AI-2E family transporter [Gammaproteobacteria bacterium]
MHKVISSWINRYLSNPEAICIIAGFLLTILFINTNGFIVTPVLSSLIIAYLLAGLVKKLQAIRIPRALAVDLVFLIFIGFFVLFLFWLLPLLWQQLVSLFNQVPHFIDRGQVLLLSLQARFPDLISTDQLTQITSSFNTYLGSIGKFVFNFSLASITNIFTVVIYLVLIPLLVFFFLRDGANILGWFTQFMPKQRLAIQQMWADVHSQIGSYIRGRIIEIIIVSLVSFVSFAFMGLPYAALLSLLVGLSVVIPYIGIVIVTIPVVIIALIQWGFTAHFFYLLAIYGVIVVLDANVLVPLLFSQAMNLHPVAIILAVLVFGNIGGFWGIFLAIPLLTLFSALIKFWPKTKA